MYDNDEDFMKEWGHLFGTGDKELTEDERSELVILYYEN